MRLWRVVNDQSGWHVKRGGRIIVDIEQQKNGTFKWIGFGGRYRVGFKSEAALLEDVKYFHRYGWQGTTLTFESGRKLVLR